MFYITSFARVPLLLALFGGVYQNTLSCISQVVWTRMLLSAMVISMGWKWTIIITIAKNGNLNVEDCRNPSLGLATKARACKGVGQERSSEVTSHNPRSVGKCEGMNLHIPKWAPTLGVRVLMDSQIFKEQLQGSKPIKLENSLYHSKFLGT